MFATLLSKTMLILSISLLFCFLGALSIIQYFRIAYKNGAHYVTTTTNPDGQPDLQVNPVLLKTIFWPALIINVIAFIVLMFTRSIMPVNFISMAIMTFTGGITIGIILLAVDENIGIKVTALTAVTTLLAAIIGMHSGIDFSFLSKFLYFGLIGLIIISLGRIFISIRGWHRKVLALIGILIFVGYILLDFNNLQKVKNIAKLNTWTTALDFSVSIYLDIINLLLQILDLLSID